MNLKRWIPKLVALALVAGGAAFLLIKKPWAKGAAPITFQTVTVGRGPIAAQVTANGTLSARGTVLVGAQVSGRVLEIFVDFNSPVKKGQIIAKLDESLLKAQIDQAQAAYDLAVANQRKSKVTLDDAERQLRRQQTLQEQQLIAGATVEAAQVARDTAAASLVASGAQVSQAMANLKQARTNLSYATIISPTDGVVLSRAVDVGQTVAASLQAPTLFTIAEDLSRMQIDTAVAEADVGRLTESMKATFTVDAFPGKAFEGVVRQVRNAPTTTSGVVTYDAVIDVDNPDKSLRPGMTANVTFVLAQVADAVKIPNAALRFKPTREQMT
ncbi:MAG TPA: efflux RND transporter periplasmic adaptor subunit, partial [Kofleriaceae bacterium]|nr:efflux RND transporter periplasmic adaptor subunit [Kofleriaceae bacterium]